MRRVGLDMDAWQELTASFRQSWLAISPAAGSARPIGRDVGVVVGCSGGADSVALVHLLNEFWQSGDQGSGDMAPLAVAHFNHRLRGEASDGDEQFVRQLAVSRGLIIEVGRAETAAGGRPVDEASLRAARRKFFAATAARLGCRVVALAHSLDDQAETVLQRFFRGTGPAGLAGMTSSSPTAFGPESDLVLRRPLLNVRRHLIRSALSGRGMAWREDASNARSDFTRNWLRNEVLPVIHQRFPDATESIARTAGLFQEQQRWLESLASVWRDHYVRLEQGGMTVRQPHPDARAVAGLDRDRTLIIAACRAQWDELGWPRGEMTMRHWRQVAGAILHAASDEHEAVTARAPGSDRDVGGGAEGQNADTRDWSAELPGGIQVRLGTDAVAFRRRTGLG